MCFSLASLSAIAQENLARIAYVKTEEMIPMRDGIKLHTVVIQPKTSRSKLPIVFSRTPYGVDEEKPETLPSTLFKEGFIFVYQDIRGRFGSEGTFVMMRPTVDFSKAMVDEGTDAYDTIEWLTKHLPNNNNRAAIYGVSYDGWTALQAVVKPHPALKVAFPMASPIDMYVNDDFHRNGAFRLSYGLEYSYLMETNKENEQIKFDSTDLYDWYLKQGPLSNITKKFGTRPTWQGFFDHPNHDAYWSDQSLARLLKTPQVPVVHVGGWWDQEDPFGPQEGYRLLARNDPKRWNHIVLGPWNHGGWMGRGKGIGTIDFGHETGTEFKNQILLPTLLYYLKDKAMKPLATASIFITGTNDWRSFDVWPPIGTSIQRMFFGEAGSLTSNQIGKGMGYDSFLSDQENPVPYRKRPIQATYSPDSKWFNWQAEDQRFLSDRKDVLSYRSTPLAENFESIGLLRARLWASTSGTDSDWVVKVIDEYPSDDANLPGYQLPINMEVVRARYRNSLEKPAPLKPNAAVEYKIDLHSIGHVFLKGHRILVQIQSSWFPVIDRNPQKFVPNIFLAAAADYQVAEQRVFRTVDKASCIEFPVQLMR